MIRIIYSWQVETKNLEKFKEVWKLTTNKIHENVVGAKGSFMITEHKNPNKILTIARWDTLKDWEAFWGAKNPKEMSGMHELGKRISVEIYDEFDDYTK